MLACRFCTLELHGKPLLAGRTHTKLERTARAGQSEIWLQEPVSWDANSMIAARDAYVPTSLGEGPVMLTPLTLLVGRQWWERAVRAQAVLPR